MITSSLNRTSVSTLPNELYYLGTGSKPEPRIFVNKMEDEGTKELDNYLLQQYSPGNKYE